MTALDAATGKELWKGPSRPATHGVPGRKTFWFFYKDVLVLVGGEGANLTVDALSAGDGKHLWSHSFEWEGKKFHYPRGMDVYGAAGLVWLVRSGPKLCWQGLDPTTGAVKREITAEGIWGRCGTNIATERYALSGGCLDFREWTTGQFYRSCVGRVSCKTVGPHIANGLVYTFPVDCKCYNMYRGTAALAPVVNPAREEDVGPVLEKGPAFGRSAGALSSGTCRPPGSGATATPEPPEPYCGCGRLAG